MGVRDINFDASEIDAGKEVRTDKMGKNPICAECAIPIVDLARKGPYGAWYHPECYNSKFTEIDNNSQLSHILEELDMIDFRDATCKFKREEEEAIVIEIEGQLRLDKDSAEKLLEKGDDIYE